MSEKIQLELHVISPKLAYLNYWNSITGDDVCAEVRNGKMNLMGDSTEISLDEFMRKVQESHGKIPQRYK